MSDDGLINSRVTENFLHGYGLVFNVGERVEAATSSLWVFLLAAFGWLGFSVEATAIYMGLALSWMGVIFAYLATLLTRKNDETSAIMLPIGLLVFVSLPPFWDFATSGLEGGLTIFWMGLSYYLICLFYETRRQSLWLFCLIAFCLSLGPLIRPDSALFSILYGGVLVLWCTRKEGGGFRWSWVFLFAFCLGLLPIGFQIFRMGYYATLVPNTALAKEAFRSNWGQGIRYIINFFHTYSVVMPALFLILLKSVWYEHIHKQGGWERVCVLGAPSLIGLIYIVYLIKLGGGFMHGRLMLGPAFCFLLPVMSLPLHTRSPLHTRWIGIGATGVLVWAILVVALVRVPKVNQFGIGDERGWYTRRASIPHPIDATHYRGHEFHKKAIALKRRWQAFCKGKKKPCRPVLLTKDYKGAHMQLRSGVLPVAKGRVASTTRFLVLQGAIGISGMALGPQAHLIDTLGLASPLASRMKLGKRRGRPGHEKSIGILWILARYTPPHKRDPKALKAARAALTCKGSPLRKLRHALSAPLTFRLFLDNLKRARSFTSLRIPPLPQKAQKAFCSTP